MTEEEFRPFCLKVWLYLETLKIGEEKSLANVDDKVNFIKAVKLCIDLTGMIEFSNDYKKIKRIQTVWEREDE